MSDQETDKTVDESIYSQPYAHPWGPGVCGHGRPMATCELRVLTWCWLPNPDVDHQTTIGTDGRERYRAECSCTWRSPWYLFADTAKGIAATHCPDPENEGDHRWRVEGHFGEHAALELRARCSCGWVGLMTETAEGARVDGRAHARCDPIIDGIVLTMAQGEGGSPAREWNPETCEYDITPGGSPDRHTARRPVPPAEDPPGPGLPHTPTTWHLEHRPDGTYAVCSCGWWARAATTQAAETAITTHNLADHPVAFQNHSPTSLQGTLTDTHHRQRSGTDVTSSGAPAAVVELSSEEVGAVLVGLLFVMASAMRDHELFEMINGLYERIKAAGDEAFDSLGGSPSGE